MAAPQVVDVAKDAGVGATGIAAYFLDQSWQSVASDFILVGSAVLLVLRIAYLLRQWWRGSTD